MGFINNIEWNKRVNLLGNFNYLRQMLVIALAIALFIWSLVYILCSVFLWTGCKVESIISFHIEIVLEMSLTRKVKRSKRSSLIF